MRLNFIGIESTHLTESFESIQLMTEVASAGIKSIQLTTQVVVLGTNSIQVMIHSKNIRL